MNVLSVLATAVVASGVMLSWATQTCVTKCQTSLAVGAEYFTVFSGVGAVVVMMQVLRLVIEERAYIYKLWRVAGASPRLVGVSILAQSSLVVLPGIAAGCVLGWLGVPLTASVIAGDAGRHSISASYGSSLAALASFLVAWLTVVGASLGPAWSAGSSVIEGNHRSRGIRRFVGFIGVTVVGLILLCVYLLTAIVTVSVIQGDGHSSLIVRPGRSDDSIPAAIALIALSSIITLFLVASGSRVIIPRVILLFSRVGRGNENLGMRLGLRMAIHDASLSRGVTAPAVLGAGVISIFFGLVDAANAVSNASYSTGSLSREEFQVLLFPGIIVALAGSSAAALILGRRKMREIALLRTMGWRGRDLISCAFWESVALASGCLFVVGCVTVFVMFAVNVLSLSAGVGVLSSMVPASAQSAQFLAFCGFILFVSLSLAVVGVVRAGPGSSVDLLEG